MVNYIDTTVEVQLVWGVETDDHQLHSTVSVERISHFFLIRHQSTCLCKVLNDDYKASTVGKVTCFISSNLFEHPDNKLEGTLYADFLT